MDESQIDKMLQTAAVRLGLTPEQLKTAVKSGDVEGIMSRLDKNSADKVRNAMSNKQMTDSILAAFKSNKNN